MKIKNLMIWILISNVALLTGMEQKLSFPQKESSETKKTISEKQSLTLPKIIIKLSNQTQRKFILYEAKKHMNDIQIELPLTNYVDKNFYQYEKQLKLADITNRKNIFTYNVRVMVTKDLKKKRVTVDIAIYYPGSSPKSTDVIIEEETGHMIKSSIAKRYELSYDDIQNLYDYHEITINILEKNKTISFDVNTELFDLAKLIDEDIEVETQTRVPQMIQATTVHKKTD